MDDKVTNYTSVLTCSNPTSWGEQGRDPVSRGCQDALPYCRSVTTLPDWGLDGARAGMAEAPGLGNYGYPKLTATNFE